MSVYVVKLNIIYNDTIRIEFNVYLLFSSLHKYINNTYV